MVDPNLKFIAEIKLEELRRQRDRLAHHYENLERRATTTKSSLEKLSLLYRGLEKAKFARKALHPEIANLEALLFEAELGVAPVKFLSEWIDRMEKELEQGRLRSEFVYIFGCLLEEWAAVQEESIQGEEGGRKEFEDRLDRLWKETSQEIDTSWFDRFIDDHKAEFDPLVKEIEQFAEWEMITEVSQAELLAQLEELSRDIYRTPQLRRQAYHLMGNESHLGEYAGTLTLLLQNLDSWNWPEEGFPLRSLWTRNKWRPYIDEDLINALLLQIIGVRWGVKLKPLLLGVRWRLLDQARNVAYQGDLYQSSHDRFRSRSIQNLRRRRMEELYLHSLGPSFDQFHGTGSYDVDGSSSDQPDIFQKLLLLLQGEIRLGQAAFPSLPQYVVRTDIRDFYLQIPHQVILHLCEKLGFPTGWIEFFTKFLQSRVQFRGETHKLSQGIPLDHILSNVLAEMVLFFFDLHLGISGGIDPIRVIDDVFLVTNDRDQAAKTWQAMVDFCQWTGLELNREKSGSIAMAPKKGDDLPPLDTNLPQSPPRWGFLELQADGTWGLYEVGLAEMQTRVSRRLQDDDLPILSMVSIYNSYVQFILRFTGPFVSLQEDHHEIIGKRMAKFHYSLFGQSQDSLFGEGRGIVDELKGTIARRFMESSHGSNFIPDAWMYWPITAGGLGLVNPLIVLSTFQSPREERIPAVPSVRGEEWLLRPNDWARLYEHYLAERYPLTPVATPIMENLMEDFIERWSEVRGQDEGGLYQWEQRRRISSYWQWVIYTYGPQLLEKFGTFRFLIPELVPLQLIVQSRISTSTL